MAGAGKKSKTVKLSVNLPQETVDVLRELADALGLTMTQVLRQSIHSEKFFRDETRQGNKILIKEPEGDFKEVVLR